MEPIRIQIPQEMFNCAQMMHLEEDVNMDCIVSGPDTIRFHEPLFWSVDLTNTGGALLVRGKVTGCAYTDCARCLEEASIALCADIEGYVVLNADGSDHDDLEEDEFEVLDDDKTFDLAPMIESAILLEIPRVPLCKQDCKGICPACGTNLNISECACGSGDDGDDGSNPFSVLKDYQF